MRKIILFIFSCTILVGCASKNKVPKKIIQPDKMGAILWDMLRVQSLAEYRSESDSMINKDAETKKLTATVFAIHKITPARFDNSYNWYVSHPVNLKIILDSLEVQKHRIIDISPEEGEDLIIQFPDTNRLIRNKKLMKKRTGKWWKNNYFKIEL